MTENDVGEDYFAERELNKGAAGWILLAGLGVAYVISGDFAGWNFGLDQRWLGRVIHRDNVNGSDVHNYDFLTC